jgi:hypothetical protein
MEMEMKKQYYQSTQGYDGEDFELRERVSEFITSA